MAEIGEIEAEERKTKLGKNFKTVIDVLFELTEKGRGADLDELSKKFLISIVQVDSYLTNGPATHNSADVNNELEEFVNSKRGASFALVGTGGRVRWVVRKVRGEKGKLEMWILDPQSRDEGAEVEQISGRLDGLLTDLASSGEITATKQSDGRFVVEKIS